MANKKLITTQEAADLIGVATTTLASWRTRKLYIDYTKIGKKILYDLEDIENFLSKVKVNIVKKD